MIHPIDQLKLIQPQKKDDSAAQLISMTVLFAGLYLLLRKPEQAVGESIIESGNPYTITKDMKRSMWSYYPLGIIKIDPDDFLDLTTDGPDELSPDTKSAIYADNKKTGVKYSDYENAGLLGYIDIHPFLEVDVDTGKVTGHEGRHRAVAAKQAGEDFYIYILPYYKNKTDKFRRDVLHGDGEKYIPDVVIGQMNLKIRVKLDKTTVRSAV